MFIIAYAGEKESIAAKVTIFITPVNDEMPVVVNNTGASVWRGGICYINSSFLGITGFNNLLKRTYLVPNCFLIVIIVCSCN